MSAEQNPSLLAQGVWITRSEPGASETALRVAALGFRPIVAPLLSVRPLEVDLAIADDDALAFTSVHAVARVAALTAHRAGPVFAVGDATAAAARAAGFSDVRSAGGDVDDLAALIVAAHPQGAVVHPAARETAGDLVGALAAAGVRARKAAVYETVAATVLPPPVEAALKAGALAGALFHSPKAARAAAAILHRKAPLLAAVTAFGLSQACLDPLRATGFKALIEAAAPNDAALLDALARLSTVGAR
jgi:uroporphyrinogen-III synthase